MDVKKFADKGNRHNSIPINRVYCKSTSHASKQTPFYATRHRTTISTHQQSASLTIELVVAGVEFAQQAQWGARRYQHDALPPEHLLALQPPVAIVTWF